MVVPHRVDSLAKAIGLIDQVAPVMADSDGAVISTMSSADPDNIKCFGIFFPPWIGWVTGGLRRPWNQLWQQIRPVWVKYAASIA